MGVFGRTGSDDGAAVVDEQRPRAAGAYVDTEVCDAASSGKSD
jgi:hypothetical protein